MKDMMEPRNKIAALMKRAVLGLPVRSTAIPESNNTGAYMIWPKRKTSCEIDLFNYLIAEL